MKTRVFVNGTFDIIHSGHLHLLNYAKSLGDVLYVGIDSDRRVKELKGSDRPINSQLDRKFLLENLKAVDEVIIFSSDEELSNLVRAISPHYMIVGNDYYGKKVIGSEYAEDLKFYAKIDGYSTTGIINKIKE